jgi:hypothetical protein
MLTPSMGGINVGHHSGIKCCVIPGPQLFAFAGDQGQAARFRHIAENLAVNLAVAAHPLLHGVALSQAILTQLASTGIQVQSVGVNAVLSFLHGGACYTCAFEGAMQPRLLDQNHYYVALGSGKLSADPFLRFVTDTFCAVGQSPGVHLATFLAVWTVQHVINVNPGGVAGPIRVSVFERDPALAFAAKELSTAEIDAHLSAVNDAEQALRDWRNGIQGGAAAGNVLAPPAGPAPGPPAPVPAGAAPAIQP